MCGALLAYDVGLGKTIICIILMLLRRRPIAIPPAVPLDVAADVVMQDASPLPSSQSARVDNLSPPSTTPPQSNPVDNPPPPSTTPAQSTRLKKDATVRKAKVDPSVLRKNRPTLIVVRSNAVSVWITEFKTWFSMVCVRYWFGSKTTGRQNRRSQTLGTHYRDLATYLKSQPDTPATGVQVIITSYQTLRGRSLYLDESVSKEDFEFLWVKGEDARTHNQKTNGDEDDKDADNKDVAYSTRTTAIVMIKI